MHHFLILWHFHTASLLIVIFAWRWQNPGLKGDLGLKNTNSHKLTDILYIFNPDFVKQTCGHYTLRAEEHSHNQNNSPLPVQASWLISGH